MVRPFAVGVKCRRSDSAWLAESDLERRLVIQQVYKQRRLIALDEWQGLAA